MERRKTQNINIITKEEVVTLLTQDSYYRKLKKWPLLTSKDILRLSSFRASIEGIFSIASDVRSWEQTHTMKLFTRDLNNKHPFITKLLLKFKGNLVASGGAIIKRVVNHSMHTIEDIDLFFYDLTVSEATELRRQAIIFLINEWETTQDNVTFAVTRNEFVTTIYVYRAEKTNIYIWRNRARYYSLLSTNSSYLS